MFSLLYRLERWKWRTRCLMTRLYIIRGITSKCWTLHAHTFTHRYTLLWWKSLDLTLHAYRNGGSWQRWYKMIVFLLPLDYICPPQYGFYFKFMLDSFIYFWHWFCHSCLFTQCYQSPPRYVPVGVLCPSWDCSSTIVTFLNFCSYFQRMWSNSRRVQQTDTPTHIHKLGNRCRLLVLSCIASVSTTFLTDQISVIPL